MNSTVTKYLFGPSGIVAKVKGGSTTYFHQDHLGSTLPLIDCKNANL